MIFRPQNGTPENLARFRRCMEIINIVIHTKDFTSKVDAEVVEGLHNYDSAEVMFFYQDNMVAGMANEFENLIRLNTKFFGKNFADDCKTIVHEWLHLLGYDHESSKDYTSVPYSVGRYVKTLINEREDNLKNRIRLFWMKWAGIKILEGLFIVVSLPLLPLAFFLKHVLKINVFKWMLNDTEDGDYGADWWLEREGLKPSLWSAFRWWLRNPVWNFKLLFKPGDHANTTIIKVVKHEVGSSPFEWVRQDKRGTNHLYYEIDGVLHGRYSKSNNWINMYFGTGGRRHILKIRKSHE